MNIPMSVRACAICVAGASISLGGQGAAPTQAAAEPQGDPPHLEVSKEAPSSVEVGETATVFLDVCALGEATGCPLDVVLLIDISETMGDPMSKYDDAIDAALALVDKLGNNDQSALVTVASDAEVVKGLDFNHTGNGGTAEEIENLPGPAGSTPLEEGVEVAQSVLTGPDHRPQAIPVMVVFSDGIYTDADPVPPAEEARMEGTIIYTIVFGDDDDGHTTMHDMASPSVNMGGIIISYFTTSQFDLLDEFNLLANVAATEVVLVEVVNEQFEIGTISPPPTSTDGNTITWELPDAVVGADPSTPMLIGDCFKVSFEISTDRCGEFPIDDEGSQVNYKSCEGEEVSAPIPNVDIDVVGCNHPPECDAGGPYVQECQGVITEVELDGTNSSDPDEDRLDYDWSSDCPEAFFDDPTSPTPVLVLTSSPGCDVECTVTLTVSDGEFFVDCETTVTVQDMLEPVIECPPDAEVECGEPTDPEHTGEAEASDQCDPDPEIGFEDEVTPTDCPADPVQEVIEREWTATDECDLSSSCVQTITVLKRVASLDIKPASCPNPLNVDSGGLLPVSVLGTDELDVHDIVQDSLLISRADCVGGAIAPRKAPGPVFEDAGTPFVGEPCDCHDLAGDGVEDLSLKFDKKDLVEALQLGDLPPGTTIELCVSGELDDGCEFIACDCVTIVARPDGPPLSQTALAGPFTLDRLIRLIDRVLRLRFVPLADTGSAPQRPAPG